ncbi:uncharacterized protein LOC121261634 [Juglans microcarpa x Juglans regia]|uniref:uncharacterized protein LOC121261634 n=1 Tax=Juglans microcarpa x Juglans regia TaxID=2249226 RepID=UPI001B7F0207|nr:uncharacterized protein LOC121261634 [Juglans microcarpa x Juglans regia]
MAASATASGAPKLYYSASQYGHSKPATKIAMGTIQFYIQNNVNFPRRSAQWSFPIRALDPQRGEEEEQEDSSKNNKTGAITSQEDLEYLWKLVAGSVVGAAVLKYGSAVFPEITRPNIAQALIMISAPVIVAVFLLIKQSRAER